MLSGKLTLRPQTRCSAGARGGGLRLRRSLCDPALHCSRRVLVLRHLVELAKGGGAVPCRGGTCVKRALCAS